jgi:outer membrane lipoprotein-sorting protein
MKKYILVTLILFLSSKASASLKESIILNLKNINNINFNFEQNINGKIENGNCTIQYPKKIFCKYNLGNQKILVSDGKSLIIKTTASYYKYPLDKTPLNYLLDKEFLIKKINVSNTRNIQEKLINFRFTENENEINVFFDINNHNLIGWQTLDMYQNLSITFLSSISKNKKLKRNLFQLPNRN